MTTVSRPGVAAHAVAPIRRTAAEKHLLIGAFGRLFFAGLASLATYGVPIVVGLYSRDAGIACGVLLTVALTIVLVGTYPPAYLCYWVTLAVFQNFTAALWINPNGTSSVPIAITESKTISMLVASVLLIRGMNRLVRSLKGVRLGLLLLLLGLVTNFRQPGLAAIATLRNFLLPTLILLVAFTIAQSMTIQARVAAVRGLIYFITFCLTCGSAAEIIVGTNQWRAAFHVSSLAGLNSLSHKTSLFGLHLERVGGILFEPIDAGYVAASIVVSVIILRMAAPTERNGADFAALFGAAFCVAAAATKNGLLMFMVVAVAYFYLRRGLTPRQIIVRSMAASWLVTYLYIILIKGPRAVVDVFTNPIGISGGGGDSTSIHMAGLMSGLRETLIDPVGHGLGSGGNFQAVLSSNALHGKARLITGAESSWGTLGYQAGILSLIGLWILVTALANGVLEGPGVIAIAVWASGALFAETWFGPIDASVLLITSALLISRKGAGSDSAPG